MASTVVMRPIEAENLAAREGTFRQVATRAPEFAPSVEADYDVVIGIQQSATRKRDAIYADTKLSVPDGVTDALTKALNPDKAAVIEFEARKLTRGYDVRIAQVQKILADKVAPPKAADMAEAVTREMRGREVRDRLLAAGASLADLAAVAASAEDAATFDAIAAGVVVTKSSDGAVMLTRMIPEDMRAKALAARAQAVDPENSELLAKLTDLRGVYVQFIESAKRSLIEACPSLREPGAPILGSQQK
jgi:hypothetical protein